MKSKIAITLDEGVLKRIDGLAKNQSRSSYIEKIIRDYIHTVKLDTAVLLAGGEGTRLRPFTYEMPKPMVPVRGRPVIRWQVDMLRRMGITNIIITLKQDEKNTQIIKEFGNTVSYSFENEPMGTGGALMQVRDSVGSRFLVMNADTLHSPAPNLQGMHDFHVQKGAAATLLLMPKEDVRRYGTVELDMDSRIVEFREKSPEKKAGIISSGIYILSSDVFRYIKGKCSIENDVFPAIRNDGKLWGYFFNGKTYDIGTLEGYEHAIKEWKP
jgi:NDP-sugar pyrophosphorylase family protein